MMLRYTVLFLFLSIWSACRKDSIVENKTTIPIEPSISIETTVKGIVLDETNEAIANARVHLDGNITITDEHGFFTIRGLAPKNHAFAKIVKAGYWNNHAAFSAHSEGAFLRVILEKRQSSGHLATGIGGSVSSNGVTLNLTPNSMVDASGEIYHGKIEAYLHYIDPCNTSSHQRISGNFSAKDSLQQLQVLQSFGVAHIELITNSGTPLQSQEALDIQIPIPFNLRDNAPKQVYLWYFDEASAYWKQEGMAVFQENSYRGSITKTGFWMSAIGSPAIYMEGQVQQGTTPIGNTQIQILNANKGTSIYTYTNPSGFFGSIAPQDEAVSVAIVDNCHTIIYEADEKIFAENVILESILLDDTGDFIQLLGCIYDCTTYQLLDPAYLKIQAEGSPYFTIVETNENGQFSTVVGTCGIGKKLFFNAIDPKNQIKGLPQEFKNTGNLKDLGGLYACVETPQEEVFIKPNIYPAITLDNCTGTFNKTDNEFIFTSIYTDDETEIAINFTLKNATEDFNNPAWTLAVSSTLISGELTQYDFSSLPYTAELLFYTKEHVSFRVQTMLLEDATLPPPNNFETSLELIVQL